MMTSDEIKAKIEELLIESEKFSIESGTFYAVLAAAWIRYLEARKA